MFDQLQSLLTVVLMTLAAYGLGRPLLRGLGVGDDDRLTAGVWSVAAGLILAGMLLTLLGLVGVLYAPLVGLLTMAGAFWGVGQLTQAGFLRRRERGELRRTDTAPAGCPAPPRVVLAAVLTLAALACLGSLVGALAPPTAGDAICYHLELPKAFLADHAIHFLVDSDNSTFPLLTEIWYLWALALDGPVATGLTHWGLGVLLALAAAVLARPLVGPRWAWIAAALVVLAPGVNNQMTAPMNDLALAVFTTLALAAWLRGMEDDQSRRWFVLAGLAGGGALGTKYLALVFAAALAVVCGWTFLRRPLRRRRLIEGVAVVAVVAVSIGGLWYVRAAYHRGNPCYPFLQEVFTSAENKPPDHQTLPTSKSPLGRSLQGFAAAPWVVTMRPERFGGRGHQLGPLFLALLPGLVLARRLRGLTPILATAFVYSLLWYLLRQNVRFLFPIVAPLCLMVTWVLMETSRLPRTPRWLVGAAVASVLVACSMNSMTRCSDRLSTAVGVRSRSDYLQEHEPTWSAAQLSNRCFGPQAHLLSQDYRAYYFQCRVTREHNFRRRTAYDQQLAKADDLAAVLRRSGITHLLLAENLSNTGMEYDATLTNLVDAAWAAGCGDSLVTLSDYRTLDPDGGVRRYRLVMLR